MLKHDRCYRFRNRHGSAAVSARGYSIVLR